MTRMHIYGEHNLFLNIDKLLREYKLYMTVIEKKK